MQARRLQKGNTQKKWKNSKVQSSNELSEKGRLMERIREERDSLLRRWKNLQSRNDCKDNLEERKRNRWLICQRRGLLPTDLTRRKRRRNRSLVVVTATLRWAMHCGFPFPSTSVSLEVSLLFYWGDFAASICCDLLIRGREYGIPSSSLTTLISYHPLHVGVLWNHPCW